MYNPSKKAQFQSFLEGVQQFYAPDTVVLDDFAQLIQLNHPHRSIILHLSQSDIKEHWSQISTFLQQLRTGQLTRHIPQSMLLLSTQPLPKWSKLSGGPLESIFLDIHSFLC